MSVLRHVLLRCCYCPDIKTSERISGLSAVSPQHFGLTYHVWAHGAESKPGTPGVSKSTGGCSCGGPEPPTNPPQQVTMAERKLPCCCGSSVSQRRSTKGPNLPPSLGSNLVPFPPSVPHSQTRSGRMTAHHAVRRHNGANNVAASLLLLSASRGRCQNGC